MNLTRDEIIALFEADGWFENTQGWHTTTNAYGRKTHSCRYVNKEGMKMEVSETNWRPLGNENITQGSLVLTFYRNMRELVDGVVWKRIYLE